MKRSKANLSGFRIVMIGMIVILHIETVIGQACNSSAPAPSSNRNYIMTRVPIVAGIKDSDQLNLASASRAQVQTTIQYFDGLGRPLQTIQVQASPNQYDIIQPFAYDAYGREPVKYLPYVSNSCATGFYHTDALTSATDYPGSEQYQYHQQGNQNIPVDASPYAQTVFEPSPLNRSQEQGAVGNAWQPFNSGISTSGHTIKMDYGFNNAITDTTDANFRGVKYYTATSSNNDQTRVLTDAGWYAANELTLTIAKDENWVSGRKSIVEEYKDKQGRIILKRLWQSEVSPLSTYYIYDEMGNLSFVLPPLAEPDKGGITQTILDQLCYQYQYDAKRRQIAKRLPGRDDWDEMVYNDMDQLVVSRDPNQKAAGKWEFKKYDAIGRNVASGLVSNIDARSIWQSNIDGQTILWEGRDINNSNGTGYTSSTLPLHSSVQVYHTINYYDTYDNIDFQIADFVSVLDLTARGMPTGARANVLGTTQNVYTVIEYDSNWRPSISAERNEYNGIYAALTYFSYDFTGKITQKRQELNGSTIFDDRSETFSFDNSSRPISATEQFGYAFSNSSGSAMIFKNSYNELGQLMKKQLHSEDSGTTFLQDIDYKYNERGWLTAINDPTNVTTTRLFGMELSYNTSVNGSAAQYNGNVSGEKWQASVPVGISLIQYPMTYGFTYDGVNRLTNSSYGSDINNDDTHYFDENLTFDKGGNIRSLDRYTDDSGSATLIDQLRYTYDHSYESNRLTSVTDNSGRNEGLQAGTSNYTYDANGNIKSDDGKGITNIDYNFLNLPQTITKSSGNISYVYDATGRKLAMITTSALHNYFDGWEFNATQVTQVATPEGLARFDANSTSYSFEYSLKDNLGNTRLTFKKSSSGVAQVVQVNHYYPYGMSFQGGSYQYTSSGNENLYKYNGKEQQEETGFYDYGARFYDPVTARWASIDPLAEKSRRWSTYNYAYNNPLRFIDPDGMIPVVDPFGRTQMVNLEDVVPQMSLSQEIANRTMKEAAEFQDIMDGNSTGGLSMDDPASALLTDGGDDIPNNNDSVEPAAPDENTDTSAKQGNWPDPVNTTMIAGLDPRLQQQATYFLDWAYYGYGVNLRITQGFRSVQQQNDFYELGRTVVNPDGRSKSKPMGNIVTHARGGQSFHQYGLAFDVVIMENGQPNWLKTLPPEIVRLGEAFGFEWGGHWRTGKVDPPHFQMTFGQTWQQLYKQAQH